MTRTACRVSKQRPGDLAGRFTHVHIMVTNVVLILALASAGPKASTRTDTATALHSDAVAVAAAPPSDTDVAPLATERIAGPLLRAAQAGVDASSDTVRRRPRAIEMSDAAILRLQIHRYASYTVIPLFALQSIAGNQLYQADKSGADRPGWAESSHQIGAAALGTVFAVNTVTGLWALWDARHNAEGRTRRWVHSALLLASDAGFTYTGIQLAHDAKNSQESRNRHRNYAYASMGVALTGYGVMLIGNR
jgi:hypothetical protein